jgi:predicted flap endonuclease-1-like 5' DNA nuclease
MWGKRIVRTVGILVFALLGFGSVALLVRWLLSRREMRVAVPAIEIDIKVPPVAPQKPATEEEAAAPAPEALVAHVGARVPELQPEVSQGQSITAELSAPGEPDRPDDLKRIQGIGPKIARVLGEAGIMTFSQLADSEAGRLRQILGESDPRLLRLADPTSWPGQAKLAASGDWDALKALQGTL